jgi:uncharacterized protein YjbI with pentapeptide repeats
MANMSDSRVQAVLAHAAACREAKGTGENVPALTPVLTQLAGIDLSGANLTGADLTDARLYEADLKGANLTGADLTDAILLRADLEYANLTAANLTGAMLTHANLKGANLILLTNATNDTDPRPHVLLQKEKDGKLRIKVISLWY